MRQAERTGERPFAQTVYAHRDFAADRYCDAVARSVVSTSTDNLIAVAAESLKVIGIYRAIDAGKLTSAAIVELKFR